MAVNIGFYFLDVATKFLGDKTYVASPKIALIMQKQAFPVKTSTFHVKTLL